MINNPCSSIDFAPLVGRLATLLLLCQIAFRTLAAPLPSYNVDIAKTSVSGISSGGYMALQFALAHADIVTGVGVFAGGPYRCAANGVGTALSTCMLGKPDPLQAVLETNTAAAHGRIASTSNIGRWRVWLFSGYNDGVVKQSVMNSLYDSLAQFVPAPQVYYQNTLAAGHAMITLADGESCSLTGGAFINDCDYDAAGLLLQHIYGRLTAPATGSPTGQIVEFDQESYTRGGVQGSGLADQGYLYVPQSCARGEQCGVHIAFHGCRQYAEEIGDLFYRLAGYNRWADDNHLIILYPQTQATHLRPFNPKGCWDWWGYTSPDFAFREGIQISAVRGMLDQLAQGYRQPQSAPAPKPVELLATDATDHSVSLAWSGGDGSRYHISRAANSSDNFQRITTMAQSGNSYVDTGLAPKTTYQYRLESDSGNGATLLSNTAAVETRASPPHCDPYFSDNVTHVSEGRARVWWGFAFARGSWDYMGLWNLFTETALYKDDDGAFQVGVCADRSN